MDKKRIVRLALVASVTAAVSVPVVSQALRSRARAEPAGAPAPAPSAAPAPAAAPASQPANADPSHVIIEVGDEKITVGDFDAFLADLSPQSQAAARRPGGKRALAEEMIKIKLLAKEAERRHLQDSDKVKRQLEFFRQQVLANALFEDVKGAVDPAATKKYYDEHKQELDRIAARHILIRTPGSRVPLRQGQKELTNEQALAKAEDISKRLKGGADFAALAKTESDDTGSGAEGGDLGSFGQGRMVPEFEKAAFALKEGEISSPVKTPFGYHVIQVTGRFDTPEKLSDQIRTALSPKKMEDLIKGLRKDANVKVDEAYLGPELPDADQGPPGPDER